MESTARSCREYGGWKTLRTESACSQALPALRTSTSSQAVSPTCTLSKVHADGVISSFGPAAAPFMKMLTCTFLLMSTAISR